MRVVLLTAHTRDGEVQHRYVASEVVRQFGDELQAIIVATGRNVPALQKLRKWVKRYSLAQLASRLGVRLFGKLTKSGEKRQASFRSVLFPQGEDGKMPGGDKLTFVTSHNSAECIDLIERARPDIVLVYGTLIIGKKLIGSVDRIINLHTGLSPRYRGSDTIFWPIHNGEPDQIGVTVHRLEPGIDSGPILARGRPQVAGTDDEATIFAKAVALGAALLCSCARREVNGQSNPIVQDLSQGREYRSVEKTLAAERKATRLLKAGILGEGLEHWQEEY